MYVKDKKKDRPQISMEDNLINTKELIMNLNIELESKDKEYLYIYYIFSIL